GTGNYVQVIEQQCVYCSPTRAPALQFSLLSSFNEFLDELVGGNTGNGGGIIHAFAKQVADGVKQVRLACAARTTDHKRIEVAARFGSNRLCRTSSQLVAYANLEVRQRERCVGPRK